MAEFLHPSVRSRIIDNSIVFVTAQGQTMLYAAFKAERGPDNRPTLITSESEFLFKFGNPNMRKYGQTPYNVINWLRAGGVALCTRVLPAASGAAPEDGTPSTYPAYILEIGLLQNGVKASKALATLAANKLDTVVEATDAGVGGNAITVALTGDSAPAAGVTISRVGSAITIHYESGVSTVLHVETAIGALTGADDIIAVKTPGTAITVLTATADNFVATSLAGGVAGTGPATTGKKLKTRVRTLGDGLNASLLSADELKIRDDVSLRTLVLKAPTTIETDNYKYYPILVLRGESRGPYFNGFAPMVSLLTAFDQDFDHRTYELSIMGSPTQVAEGPYVVSLYPEAVDRSGRSQFIEDVINGNSSVTRALFSEANYDSVTAYINATAANWKKLDVLTLKERTVTTPETIHASVTEAAAPVDLTAYHPMGGGSEGLWTGPNVEEALLFKAYSGSGDVIDPTTLVNSYDTYFSDVLDKDQFPIDMMLDANLPQSVKVALSNLAVTRGDCMAMLDVGFTSSPAAAEAYRKTQLTVNTIHSAIFAQDYVVFDEFQGNDIRVTSTYYLASKIPQVDSDFGLHWPFVGPRRGTIAGFKSASWFPNAAWRERLYKVKVNYSEKDTARGIVALMGQATSQVINSALSDINHVRTLLRIRRDTEAMCKDYRFEFNDSNTMSALQYSLNNYLNQWVSNRACSSIKGTVYASEYDKQSRILRVKVEMVFNGVIERIFIDLVVNR